MPTCKTMLFTDKYIKSLRKKYPSINKPIDIREGSGKGFAVTLFPSGKISFIYIYHYNGRKRRMTLGMYRVSENDVGMTLADAKEEHNKAKMILKDNKDPALEKKNEKLEALGASSINGLITKYLNDWAKPYKRSWREDERILNKDVKSRWGSRKVFEITKRDVVLLLDSIMKRNAPIAANRTLACIRHMFNFGVDQDLISVNPCERVKAPAKENRRERSLTADEIKHFWNSLDHNDVKMSTATKLALKLQLVTAQRKGEIISAQWRDIDLATGVWTIPSERAKNGKVHRVPLSELAIEILTEIIKLNHGARWLFPANHTVEKDTHMTGAAIDHALRRSRAALTVIENFSPHSLRATATTHMASMRISSDIISRILNHAKKGVTDQHYNKYDYDDEKRNALESWSTRLKEIIYGKTSTSNIVQFKSAI